jgi:DNA-binding XRE family transcriptional regulator
VLISFLQLPFLIYYAPVKLFYQKILHDETHPARLRREIGMTQLELAETLGLHRTTIQVWEKHGHITLKPALLMMLVMANRHPLYKKEVMTPEQIKQLP